MAVGGISGYSSGTLYYLSQVQLNNHSGSSSSTADAATTLLDDGAYNFASQTGNGASSVMMFGDSWSSSTGTSGTMLDYFA